MNASTWSIRPMRCLQGADAEAWDRLNQGNALPHAMLDSRFVDAMLRAFGNGSERLCTLGEGDDVRAMCLLRPLSAVRWTTLLPSQAQVGPVQVGQVDDLRALIRQLPGRVQSLELLCIDPAIAPALLAGNERHLESVRHALTIRVDLTGDFESYWQARPKKLRDNLRRYERRLAESGFAVRQNHVTDPAAMADAVRRYARLEASGWKGQRGTALDAGNQEAFYVDVMSRFAAEGKAVIYEMWIADMLAASRMMVVCGQSMVALKTTYDEAMAMFAPGRQQMKAMIEHQFTQGRLSAIEFCTDASQDQLAWVDEHRHIEHAVLYRDAAAASLVNLGRSLRGVWRSAWIAHDDPAVTIDVYHRAENLPKDVAHLFGEAERKCVEFGAAWLRNIETSVFADHPGLRYFVLRHDNQPVAALPLVLEGPKIARRGAALANYYTALFAPAMQPWVRPTQLVPLLRALRRESGWLGSLHLAPMDPASFEYKSLLAALRMDGMATFRFFCFGNWYLNSPNDWPGYLASRDGKMRSTIKRMTAKLVAEKGRIEVISEPADVARGLAAYQQVYAASWKTAEPYPEFIGGLLETCARQRWLRLGLVWLEDRPIAAQIWIIAHGRAEIYKLAYDEAFKRYSAGTALTAVLMQQAIEAKEVVEVDYLIGDDPYKKSWMSDRRERWGLIAYNPRTPSGLWGSLREAFLRVAKRWFKRQPVAASNEAAS
ncbi:MAG: GNAT family N-acetyltransferase [Burkholderiales bacterium]|nr:GNAT family N-acetyltransferase [Burkholderiales bacterium]